jgi:predicted hydrocarbon binding protein
MGEVRLPAGGLVELRRAVEETATEDAVRALREAGRRLAADAEMAIAERGGGPLPALSMSIFWTELNRYFEEAGWGRVEHRELGRGIGALVANGWAESDPNESRGAPGCHISTGLLAELFTRAVGQPVAVMEVSCRSQGEEACRFLIGSPTTLLLVHRKLAQTGDLGDALAEI